MTIRLSSTRAHCTSYIWNTDSFFCDHKDTAKPILPWDDIRKREKYKKKKNKIKSETKAIATKKINQIQSSLAPQMASISLDKIYVFHESSSSFASRIEPMDIRTSCWIHPTLIIITSMYNVQMYKCIYMMFHEIIFIIIQENMYFIYFSWYYFGRISFR